MKLGERLKSARGDVSIKRVSKRTGVPADYIERLEDDNLNGSPSVHALYKLSGYYNCDLKELLLLGKIIIPKTEYNKCVQCGQSFENKNNRPVCESCDSRIGDPFN